MTNQTDTPTEAPGPPAPPPGDRYPDRFRGPRWGNAEDAEDEGSTWEQYQDSGTFPAWL